MKGLLRLLGFILLIGLLAQPMVYTKESTMQRVTSLLAATCDLDALIAQNHVTVIPSVEYLPRSDLKAGIAHELSFSPKDENLLAARDIIEQDNADGYYLTAYELFKLELAYLPEENRAEYFSPSSDRIVSAAYENGILKVSAYMSFY